MWKFAAKEPRLRWFRLRFTSERARRRRKRWHRLRPRRSEAKIVGRPGKAGSSKRSKRMAYPANYRYTNQHEWVDAKGDVATVGITDYAQHELGDVVFVELPKPGTKVTAGKTLGTVERSEERRVGKEGRSRWSPYH